MDIQVILYFVFIIFAGYLIGSIPTGYWLVKAVKGIDIRTIGSGSTGATNVKRVLGMWGFIVVMSLDFLKAFLPVWRAKYLDDAYGMHPAIAILPVLMSIAIIIGHSKSIFLGFKGGKSVACGVGTIFALSWPVGLITAATWVTVTYWTRYVSLASIMAVLLTPVWMFMFGEPISYIIYCLVGAVYIAFYLHKDNIKRLMAGTENKIR
jgi:acyl phosphate:glycerol-3-phosphate acyltransferase